MNNGLPRMRILDKAYDMVREADPDTSLTRHALRALAVSGRIPSAKIGAKRLINVDALIDLLPNNIESLSVDTSEVPLPAVGELRRVSRSAGR